jgi:hypothetical protein
MRVSPPSARLVGGMLTIFSCDHRRAKGQARTAPQTTVERPAQQPPFVITAMIGRPPADDGRSVPGGQQDTSRELFSAKRHAHGRPVTFACGFVRNFFRQSRQRLCDDGVRAMMPRLNVQ